MEGMGRDEKGVNVRVYMVWNGVHDQVEGDGRPEKNYYS